MEEVHGSGGDEAMRKEVTLLTGEPTIEVIAEMQLQPDGVRGLMEWVASHRRECLPETVQRRLEVGGVEDMDEWLSLFPHEGDLENVDHVPRDNELLVELAGRKCYDSFGLKAGRKSNAEYIAHTQEMDPPHASILYHAKMSFFFAGISRRVSHELIRNYVGADRSEEGAPSQESTRFTHHYGFFIMPPRYIAPDGVSAYPNEEATAEGPAFRRANKFRYAMKQAYEHYLSMVEYEIELFEEKHGESPKAMDRKRIYEAASSLLPHQSETSFIWTTNPAAIAKLVKERAGEAADLEMQRFAKKLRRICVERWPNLFPQPCMR
jgi:thymidylate synthase (FAD)